jgi:hypothetical protein
MILAPILHPLASRPGVPLPANQFALGISPATRSLVQGGTATIAVALTLVAGAAETATLSTVGLPSDVVPTWDTTTISTDGGTATLTLTADADAEAVTLDSFTIVATATSQTKRKGATVTVELNDFTVAVTNDGDSILQGDSAAFTITLTKTTGNAVTTSAIAVSGLPSGVTAVVADETISTDGGTTTCTLTASGSATIGAGSFTVTVTTADAVRTDTGTVTITGLVPVNVIAPEITDPLAVDDIAEVLNTGSWDNSPTSYTYQWTRDGDNIAGATAATYTVVSADAGTVLNCLETAHNAAGASAPEPSNGVTVSGGGGAGFTYLRPGGVDSYFRPGGVDTYIRP